MNNKNSTTIVNIKKWEIREAEKSDLDVLMNFSLHIAEETEAKILNQEKVRSGIKSVLDDPSKGIIFVACDKKIVIGCFMINGREWSEWRNGYILWLTGTYTAVEYRRMGVRKALFDFAVRWGKSQPQVIGLRGYRHKLNNAIHSAALTGGMQETEYRINEYLF